MIRALPRVALQLWIVFFIVFFGAEVIHLEPGLRVITQAVYGVPLAVWALLRLRGPVDRLDWAVLWLLAVYVLVCVFSRDQTESLGTVALASAYAVWFLLMRRAAAMGVRGPVIVAGATGLAATLALNAYLLIQEKATWYASVGAAPFEGLATFPWESVNALPVLVLVAIPFIGWLDASPVRTAGGLVVAVSAAIVVPLSLGRAGWLGLVVATIVVLASLAATRQGVMRLRPPVRMLGIAGIAVLLLIGAAVAAPRVITAIDESGRLLLWAQASNLVAANPLTGSGPGTYSWVRLEAPPASANLLAVRLLHSGPLQTLVDGGILLLVGTATAVAVWAVAALHRRAGAADMFAVASLIGFAAAFTLDDFQYLPAITLAALTAAAFLVPIGDAPSRGARRFLAPAAIGLGTVLALPSVIGVDVARASAQDGRMAMVAHRYADAVNAFETATQAHPEHGGYWLGLGMARSWAGDGAGAITAYESAVEATPGDPRAYAALAHLDLEADAIELLAAATARTLGDPQYALRLGAALASQGRVDDATHAWARAIALQPELLLRILDGVARISQEAIVDEAVLILHAEPGPAPTASLSKLWDLALASNELPDGAGLAWQAVDSARRGDLQRAAELADLAVAAVPYDARAYQAAAAVAGFACDREAEQRALELERTTGNGWAPLAPEPRTRREFVFREASLGPSQPPNATGSLGVERWPWSLIDRPECDA